MSECEHVWQRIDDWMGDPSIPNGTISFTYYQCLLCGEETDEKPENFGDDYYEHS